MASAIEVILGLNATQFQKGIGVAMSNADRFKKSIFTIGNAIRATFAGVAVQQMIAFGKSAVDMARQEELSELKLSQALLNKGQDVKAILPGLITYAEQMQQVTRMDKGQITSIMGQLASYGVLGDNIKRATTITADWVASGRSAEEVSRAIGQAMVGNTKTFRSWGLDLDKAKVSSEGLDYVLRTMGETWKGLAQEQGKGSFAQFEQYGKMFSEMKTGIGQGLAEGIGLVAENLVGSAAGMWDLTNASKELVASKITTTIGELAASLTSLAAAYEKISYIPNLMGKIAMGPFKAIGAAGKWTIDKSMGAAIAAGEWAFPSGAGAVEDWALSGNVMKASINISAATEERKRIDAIKRAARAKEIEDARSDLRRARSDQRASNMR